jgi:hypothetical protein
MSLIEQPGLSAPSKARVMFERSELDRILALYGRQVAAGEWRDYALDCEENSVSFCIYRRASEKPLFRIEKTPELARRQGAFCLYGQQGQALKRGHSLESVLNVFDSRRFKVVE